MFFDAASKGMFNRQELRNRQRRELAEAFNQFRASNPEATLEDFQSFIDQMSGGGLGSNYVRGGAPSREVLERVASENAQRKTRRLQQEAAADLRSRAEDMGYYQGLADRAVMGMTGDDFDSAYSNFLSSLGPNAEQVLNGMNLRNRFTPQVRDQLMNDRLRQLFPEINNYLGTIGYDVNRINGADIARIFNVPESQAGIFVEAAQTQARMKLHEFTTANNSAILDVARRAAEAGDGPDGAEAAVRNFLLNSPYAHLAETYNYGPIREQAERIVQQRKDEAQLAASQRQAGMEQAWEESQTLQEAWQVGDDQRALETMLRIARSRLTDADFQAMYGVSRDQATTETFRPVLNDMTASRRARQDAQYGTASRELEGRLTEANRNFVSGNQERLTEILKANLPDDQVAEMIGYQIGSTHYAGPRTAQAIFQITSGEEFQNFAKENSSNPAAIIQYLRQEMEAQGLSSDIEQARTQYINQQRDSLGLYERQEFGDWFNQETADLEADLQTARSRYDAMLSAYGENPQLLAQELMTLMNEVRGAHQSRVSEMDRRRTSATDWVYWNSGGFDREAVERDIVGRSQAETTQLLQLLQGAITNAQARAAELAQNPPVVGPTVDTPSETRSPVAGAVGDFVTDVYGVGIDIRGAANYANRGGAVGTIMTPLYGLGREIYEEGFLSEAENARREGVREWTGTNFDRLQEYGRLLQQGGQSGVYRQMIQDIGTMSSEALERKYGPALTTLARDRQLVIPN